MGEWFIQVKRKQEENKMKKIIAMIACVAAFTGFGALTATPCGYTETTTETSCQIWFKGAGSGKISTVAKSQLYKTVKTLKVSSCQLIITGGESNDTVRVVVKGTKKGVGTFEKTLDCNEFVWNVFGKNLNKVTSGSTKKAVTLDSEIYFSASDEDGDVEVSGVLTGKVSAKASGSCTPCGDTRTVKYTPGTFKGRFHGRAVVESCECASELTASLGEGTCDDSGCLQFVDPTNDMIEVFDGSITLKYDVKNSGYKSRVVTQ